MKKKKKKILLVSMDKSRKKKTRFLILKIKMKMRSLIWEELTKKMNKLNLCTLDLSHIELKQRMINKKKQRSKKDNKLINNQKKKKKKMITMRKKETIDNWRLVTEKTRDFGRDLMEKESSLCLRMIHQCFSQSLVISSQIQVQKQLMLLIGKWHYKAQEQLSLKVKKRERNI